MGKKLFILLVILMSLSLIGIIFVQTYFIDNTFKNEEKQFTLNVKRSLSFVSKEIEDREFAVFDKRLQEYIEKGGKPDTTALSEIILKYQDDVNNETVIFRNGILEESYKIPSMFFDIGLDSISLNRITNKQDTKVYSNNGIDSDFKISPEKSFQNIQTLSPLMQAHFIAATRERFKNYPIYKRITPEIVNDFLANQLKSDGIDINFEFAIYDKDLATKVQSDNFELVKSSTYGIPVFLDNNNESNFRLYVNFPDRNKFLFSSILKMMVLSIIFTLIIIIAYTSAILQLIEQRKISQIKTDFINNMTHEFK